MCPECERLISAHREALDIIRLAAEEYTGCTGSPCEIEAVWLAFTDAMEDARTVANEIRMHRETLHMTTAAAH